MKKYRLLLLSFVFLGTLLSSFHHHSDFSVDDDCSICIVQNNLDCSTDAISTLFLDYEISKNINIISPKSIYTFKINLSTLSRAPPKYS